MGKKILFISYDGMTDPLGQSQVIPYLANLSKFGYRFTIFSCDKPLKYHEFEFLRTAEYNTCITYAARKEMHTWKNIGQQPIPIEVIPCSADLVLFNPQKLNMVLQQQLKAELNITDCDFIISYLGSIG